MKRGFITVATGEWYCYLARNLVMSYKLFSDNTYPMYVITDRQGEKLLKGYFDGLIVLDNPNYNFLDKILVYKNTPFEETIFLDADMSIVKDITFLFEQFEYNNSEVSCYGTLRDITEEEPPIHFGAAAVQSFGLKQYIRFGGGMYYYKKSQKADELIDFIFDDLIPNYDKYDLLHIGAYFGNDIKKMADEPLVGLAMVVKGMKPVNQPPHLMRYYRGNMMETLSWNMNIRDLSFEWWGEVVHPYIAHYATYNTYTWKYTYYNTELFCRYHKVSVFIKPAVLLFALIRWTFSKRQMRKFFEWFFAHFTKEHFQYRREQWKQFWGKG